MGNVFGKLLGCAVAAGILVFYGVIAVLVWGSMLAPVWGVAHLVGCGGAEKSGSVAESPKTFVSQEYGFSITYPATFVQAEPRPSPFTQQLDFATVFADADSLEASQQSGNYVNAAIVGAKRLPRKLTKSEVEKFLRIAVNQLNRAPAYEATGLYSDVDIVKCKRSSLNGLSCAQIEMTFTNSRGKRQRDLTYILVAGATYYAIQLSVPDAAWQESQATMRGIAESFKTNLQ